MRTPIVFQRLLFAAVALVGIVDAAVIAGSARAESQPPIVGVGPVSTPSGGTASGTAGSGGQADACVNERHSGADSSAANPAGAVGLNDANCQESAPASGAAQGAQTGTASRAVSSSAGTARAGAAGTSSSTAAVASAQARGVQITGIVFGLGSVRSTHRLRVVVTVRDIDRRLIRDAIVTIRPLPGGTNTIVHTVSGFSNTRGRATVTVPLATKLLGQRVRLLVNARTPSARTLAIGSVRLPGITARSTQRGT